MVVMAHGLNSVLKRGANSSVIGNKSETKTGIGSRRIFPPLFKLQVLDSYRHDADCKGNQRATARKYGIHRRQIQKWLQAENNLRNSVVGKGNQSECGDATKCGLELALRSGCHRQRDDSAADAYSLCGVGAEARVPALSPIAFTESGWHEAKPAKPAKAPKAERPESGSSSSDCPHTHHQHPGSTVPLDFTTHSRAEPLALQRSDLTTPMDLSLKRPISISPAAAADHRLPTKYVALSPTSPPFCLAQPTYSTTPPSPPLTFSAYQPIASPAHSNQSTQHDSDTEIWDLSTKTINIKKEKSPTPTVSSPTPPKTVKLFKPYLDDMHENSSSSESSQAKSIELNSITYQPYYNNNIYEYKSDYSYTLHELQPKPLSPTSSHYYYPISYVNPDGEINYSFEDPNHAQFKQRQSYSLDFKLRAIECYYQDEMCRGNQRAVASKYNIHRRQVQKWLKQEEELRQRNESVKQIQAVR